MATQETKNQDNNQNTGGYVGEVEAGLGLEIGGSTSSATGGKISNGAIFNSAGSTFGLVKMLTLAGIALIALKILKGK